MNITILKKAHCGKVSTPEKETLTYNIGNCDDEYYFRVTDNDSGGFFSTEWISLTAITELLPNDKQFKVTVSDGIDAVSKTTTVTVKNVAPVTPPKESGGGGGSIGWMLIVISFGLFRKRLIKAAA